MPLFICEKCGAIENSALGIWWTRDYMKDDFIYKDKEDYGKALCSECAPEKFKDGSSTKKGKWHNRFPKEYFNKDKHNIKDFMNPKEQ